MPPVGACPCKISGNLNVDSGAATTMSAARAIYINVSASPSNLFVATRTSAPPPTAQPRTAAKKIVSLLVIKRVISCSCSNARRSSSASLPHDMGASVSLRSVSRINAKEAQTYILHTFSRAKRSSCTSQNASFCLRVLKLDERDE